MVGPSVVGSPRGSSRRLTPTTAVSVDPSPPPRHALFVRSLRRTKLATRADRHPSQGPDRTGPAAFFIFRQSVAAAGVAAAARCSRQLYRHVRSTEVCSSSVTAAAAAAAGGNACSPR